MASVLAFRLRPSYGTAARRHAHQPAARDDVGDEQRPEEKLADRRLAKAPRREHEPGDRRGIVRIEVTIEQRALLRREPLAMRGAEVRDLPKHEVDPVGLAQELRDRD